MATINVYLTFNGNCEEAFNFYKSVFGGEFAHLGRFGDMPSEEGTPSMPKSDASLIMHISLPISKETTLSGSDTGTEWGKGFVQGNNFSVSVSAESKEEADSLFLKLVEGGRVVLPLADTFWGSYFGMVTDKFGINWMMSFSKH